MTSKISLRRQKKPPLMVKPALCAPPNEVIRQAFVVLEEVLPNHVPAIAERQDEVLVAVVRVIAHQVPQNGTVADVDQRLGNGVGMLAQSCSESAAKQDHFHRLALFGS